MRDLFLFFGMMFYAPASLFSPAAGLIAWEWFSLMSPQRLVFGFAYGLPLNGIIAASTVIGLLISRERKRFPPDALPWVFLTFVLWTTFNLLFVPFPDYTLGHWNGFMRIFIEILLAFALLNNRVRIHGMIWVLVLSVGYYGVRGGAFTLATGGKYHVVGPYETILHDNNQLALAEVFMIPLIFYLARQSRARILKIGLALAGALQSLAVFGSYSRGGMIAFSVMALLFWMRTKNKILYAAIGLTIIALGLNFMPAAFWERMNTLHHVGTDDSFEGRVIAWHVAFYYARDHFPFGAGFYAPQLPAIFHRYFPDELNRAAHSIYFQVLGEQGFAGLAIYLIVLGLALRNIRIVIRLTKDRPELEWANDLARMMWVSLISFCIGGAALSMAYFDAFLLVLAMSSTLRVLASPAVVAARKPSISRSRPAQVANQPAMVTQRNSGGLSV